MRRILPNSQEEAGRPEGRERERAGREAGSDPEGGGEAEGGPQRREDKTTRENVSDVLALRIQNCKQN